MQLSDTTPNMADLGSVATALESEPFMTYVVAETEWGTKVIEAAISV
ncbi:hypothetical protein AB8Z38_09545 [Bradyrhizobium sp. LLZ17]|jgi:hypothetical protein|uniref:Uncharacterized protein n=1 Tax=Bradyrhizobium sp. LLZ17 TaxID=3239388 RepID=A0AB39XQR9_9BRAD